MDLLVRVAGMHDEPHPVLAPSHDREYNGGSIDTVRHEMEREVVSVLGACPNGDDVRDERLVVPVFVLMSGDAKKALGIGLFVGWMRGECIQIKLGDVLQPLAGLLENVSLRRLLAGVDSLTFSACSLTISLNPARAAANSVKGGATEQMKILAWLMNIHRTVLLDRMTA